MKNTTETKTFKTSQSISRAKEYGELPPIRSIVSDGNEYAWATNMEKVSIINQGIPYGSIEIIGKRLNLPIKDMLSIFSLPQTTYNKKKREKSLLNGRDSETVLLLTELIDFGTAVFNNEEDKFQRWLKKPNLSLGGNTPESLFNSITGIEEVKNCLNRLEYGNLA